MSDQIFVIVLTAILTTAWTASRVLKPLGEALVRRMAAGKGEPNSDHDARLAELTACLGELAERLDFTERVLLQERQPGKLGQGRSR